MTPQDHDYGRVRPRHRGVDIPDKVMHPWRYRWAVLRWRAAILTVTHTVLLATGVAFLIASIPAWLILVQSKQTAHLASAIQAQRVSTTTVFCVHMNWNTRAVNRENDYLQGLIVNGAEQTKTFDRQLRALGLPPYAERLRKAQEQATGLDRLRVKPLDCASLLREVRGVSRK